MVERAVQSAKSVLKKIVLESAELNLNLSEKIEQFLGNYRNLPHTQDNIVPSHLMFAFKPKVQLDLIKIEKNDKKTDDNNEFKNEKGKKEEDNVVHFEKREKKDESNEKLIEYSVNENVLYKNFLKGYVKWHKATILERKSKHVYLINVNNLIKLAHFNQLKKSIMKNKNNTNMSNERNEANYENENQGQMSADHESQEYNRRSNRNRRQPDWYRSN